jgi:NADH:ubiquinone oxidoreductase subunit F (NADH-binding)
MRYRPHLVLNGLFCAAEAVEADRAIVYSADSSSLESVRGAIAELEAPPLPVEFFRADDTYVAGEETAAVRAINEGIAKPTAKPPRPFERGVDSRPTLVHNVETLAVVALLATGTDNGAMTRAATFLATIHGACSRPGLYELPYGITLADALEHAAGGASGNVPGFLMGGYFAGFLNRRGLGLRLSFDDLREAGSGLGCAAITVLGETDCPVAVAATVMRFFARESAGQCGPCVKGTAALSETLDSFTAGQGTHADLERVEQWSTTLRGRGACALLDGATLLVRSLLREFSETVRDHIHGSCPLCRRSSAPLL